MAPMGDASPSLWGGVVPEPSVAPSPPSAVAQVKTKKDVAAAFAVIKQEDGTEGKGEKVDNSGEPPKQIQEYLRNYLHRKEYGWLTRACDACSGGNPQIECIKGNNDYKCSQCRARGRHQRCDFSTYKSTKAFLKVRGQQMNEQERLVEKNRMMVSLNEKSVAYDRARRELAIRARREGPPAGEVCVYQLGAAQLAHGEEESLGTPGANASFLCSASPAASSPGNQVHGTTRSVVNTIPYSSSSVSAGGSEPVLHGGANFPHAQYGAAGYVPVPYSIPYTVPQQAAHVRPPPSGEKQS
ncbi:hypothetical protein PG987_010674 [Apiospora arundinis]